MTFINFNVTDDDDDDDDDDVVSQKKHSVYENSFKHSKIIYITNFFFWQNYFNAIYDDTLFIGTKINKSFKMDKFQGKAFHVFETF